MGGLGVIFFIAFYLVIALKVFGKFKASRYKWLVVALIVLIPSGDAVVGRLYLKYLCANEGGLKVYRVAERVEGFMEDGGIDDDWVKNGGYQFSESAPVNGLVTRYSRQPDGRIIKEESVMPKSKYRVRSIVLGQHDIYMRYQYEVADQAGIEVLATDTQIGFNGGWAERFLAQFSDAGGGGVAWCGNVSDGPVIRHREVISSSLKY
jgi:hypothetical protein